MINQLILLIIICKSGGNYYANYSKSIWQQIMYCSIILGKDISHLYQDFKQLLKTIYCLRAWRSGDVRLVYKGCVFCKIK